MAVIGTSKLKVEVQECGNCEKKFDVNFAARMRRAQVRHDAVQGEMVGHRPTSDFHKKNFAIIKLLLNLYKSDATVQKIFWAWVRNVHVKQLLGSEAA